jgi:hypothetical protein
MYCSSAKPVITLAILALFLLSNYSICSRYLFARDVYATNVKAAVSSTVPTFNDPTLRAELVVQGLSYPNQHGVYR